MDPNKSASAPPADWTDQKSPMGQAPPYHDIPSQGYPPSYPGSPLQPQGYGASPQYGGAVYGQQQHPMGQQYPAQLATITDQPMYMTHAPLPIPYDDYLCYSIFTMLCCCFPLGIIALIFSIFTREANLVGNQTGAERNSRMARIMNHVALGLGIGIFILSIVYVVVVLSIASN